MNTVRLRKKGQVLNRGIPVDLTTHFNSNVKYFNYLLNKDFTGEFTILTNWDKEKIKEAYNKAHHIREYEINLFWSRLNYLWLINAVFFSAWGVIVYSMLNAKEVTYLQYATLFLLSSFGSAFTYLATSIVKAGKYWQQVWEYHVHTLEPFVSGNLYSMPFTQVLPKPSISRSIMVFFAFSLIIWVVSAILAVVLPSFDSKFVLLFEVLAMATIFIIFYLIDKSIKKPSNNNIVLDD
ncbi:hypothetical protein ACNY68_08585 [Pantoea sp. KXB25]|uniref:RipA family octameric membrane protein n=1 Tax=unclassified Pantoea TaxID=2630326 RepID=UPI003AB517FE